MGVVLLDELAVVVTADANAQRLLAVDGQQVEPGMSWHGMEQAGRTWLVARREPVEANTGKMTFAHLAPLNVNVDGLTEKPTDQPTRAANNGEYLAAVLECLDTGVMALDSTMAPVVVNAALRSLHGYPAKALGGHWPGRPLVYNTDGSELADEERLVAMVLREGEVRGLRRGLRNETTGELRQVSVNARTVITGEGTFAGVVLAVQDVHSAVQAERELARQASIDHLTQIRNRRGLHEAVLHNSALKGRPPETVLICDVNHFKALNDTFGHAVGDEALRVIAQVLSECATTDRVVARLGGDEFAVVAWDDMAGVEAAIALMLAGRLANLPTVKVSLSCGIARSEKQALSLEELMTAADHIMYAKRARRRRIGDDSTASQSRKIAQLA